MSTPSGRVLFSVVREDSAVELALVERTEARAVLLVASAGCTALDLLVAKPSLEVVAFDRSEAQRALVEKKLEALARGDLPAFRTGDLLQAGAFEGLFRVLRHALEELALPGVRAPLSPAEPAGFAPYFAEPSFRARLAFVDRLVASPYFEACFAAVFGGELLHAMFGPAATQHAAKGSYPAYFRAAFERGLRSENGAQNRFLQHVLLGRYLERSEPLYLQSLAREGTLPGPVTRLRLVAGTLLDVADLSRFQVVSLSNVFDWSDDDVAAAWATRLGEELVTGALVVVRKLNNRRDVGRFFAPSFAREESLGRELLARDRSLFYEAIEIYRRA